MKRRRFKIRWGRLIFVLVLAGLAIFLGVLAIKSIIGQNNSEPVPGIEEPTPTPDAANTDPTATPEPTPEPTPSFDTPHAVEVSDPEKYGFAYGIQVDGEKVDSFVREEPITFGKGHEYTQVDGITTFRGNNYRESGSYGTASVTQKELELIWTVNSGSMPKGDGGTGSWTGSGWVGQPLIVRWPESTKRIMNMYDWAKEKADLVEVILATMDGNVYFLDLETGEKTRDKLRINMPFKGAGSLDPRGYPILYLGSGDSYSSDEQKTRAMAYSLINFERLYEFGKKKDSFALRGWHAYDSAPLVDAETDTLIYPGENGILYTVQLNTVYDEAAGTLSMNPGPMVKFRYEADRTGDDDFWLGYEGSTVAWGEHIYLVDNAGLMQCININTLEPVWIADTWDDTNGTPVLEEDPENHTAYLYVGTSLHWTKDSDSSGIAPFFKVDAVTGEILWQYDKKVKTVSGVSGGIQATAVVGQHEISDLVIIPFARTPSTSKGQLVALDKETGEERWTFDMSQYAWSSPVAVYDEQGKAYIIQCDTYNHIYLLDGATGELLDTLEFESDNFEASPAVYGDTLVIGSRAAKIYGVKIK